MLQSMSKNATVIGLIFLIPGAIITVVGALGLVRGRLLVLTSTGRGGGGGATIWLYGLAARVFGALFTIAGLFTVIPGFLLVFRVFFDISTEFMLALMIMALLFFVFVDVIALMRANKSAP